VSSMPAGRPRGQVARPTASGGAGTLRIMTYNICEGGGDRLDHIAAIVKRQRPHAVALLEANSRALVEALARDLGMALVYGEANCPASVAWLTSLPIRRTYNHRLPALAKTLLELEAAWDARVVRLFATHLASRHDEPAHSRLEEMQAILGVLSAAGTVPHLLVGDLNSVHPDDSPGTPPPDVVKRGEALAGAPRPVIRRLLQAGYVDCYRARHPRTPGYTYPAQAPWLRLDYVFASPPMARYLRGCTVLTEAVAAEASDHVAVRAEFQPWPPCQERRCGPDHDEVPHTAARERAG